MQQIYTLWKVIQASLLAVLIVSISVNSLEINNCPATPTECYCNPKEVSLNCPTTTVKVPWDMRNTFEQIVKSVSNSSNNSSSFVYDKLELSGANFVTRNITLKVPKDAIPENSLKFREISIFSFDRFVHIDPNAFPGTYDATEVLKISHHALPYSPQIFQFFSKFTKLCRLGLSQVTVPTIPERAFANGSTTLEVIEIINGEVETIGAYAFAECPGLTEVDLQYNKLTDAGISPDAFKGIPEGTAVVLLYNSGITHLPQGTFEEFLQKTNASLSVGSLVSSDQDTTYYLHCDERALWICTNVDLYKKKLSGFRCKGLVNEFVFDYCKEIGKTPSDSETTTAGGVDSASTVQKGSGALLLFIFLASVI